MSNMISIIQIEEVAKMRNEMNRENMMRSCRSALANLAGIDNKTMRDVADMSLRSSGAGNTIREDILSSIAGERSAAAEDFSF